MVGNSRKFIPSENSDGHAFDFVKLLKSWNVFGKYFHISHHHGYIILEMLTLWTLRTHIFAYLDEFSFHKCSDKKTSVTMSCISYLIKILGVFYTVVIYRLPSPLFLQLLCFLSRAHCHSLTHILTHPQANGKKLYSGKYEGRNKSIMGKQITLWNWKQFWTGRERGSDVDCHVKRGPTWRLVFPHFDDGNVCVDNHVQGRWWGKIERTFSDSCQCVLDKEGSSKGRQEKLRLFRVEVFWSSCFFLGVISATKWLCPEHKLGYAPSLLQHH